MKILITGTSGGIGGAVAQAARSAGYEVSEVNRTDFADLAEWSAKRREEGTRFDALVFASGTCPIRPVALTADELFEETIKVNCGLFLALMRTIVAEKLYNPAGMKAVAVSSVSATEGWPGGAAYCASKGALSAMCRAMDAELKPKKISVKTIEPRYVLTRMFTEGAGRMGVPASAAIEPDAFAREVLAEL